MSSAIIHADKPTPPVQRAALIAFIVMMRFVTLLFEGMTGIISIKATPHKARLTAWQRIYLHIFRHLARKLLAGRQPSGVIFIQSDEKSDCVSCAPDLISASLGIAGSYSCISHANAFAVRRSGSLK